MKLNAPRQVMFTYLKNHRMLSLVLACFLLSVNVAAEDDLPLSTPILDSNFEQALILLNIDTNGLNGNILNSDALAVTTLSIANKSISDLTGIEAFGNLVNLFASSNNIVSVDFSQNTALQVVNLENNKITSLNVSNNSALKDLIISNNLLSGIDISNNLQLEYLSCNLNAITAIDVSTNVNLKVLRCYSNNLSTINLSANLDLEMLFISDNNLNALDVSLNTGLETLTFDNNNISSIDLTSNTILEYLGCSNNNLSELNISQNPSITRLLCNNNVINAIDVSSVPDLFLFYTMNNQIQTLDLTGNTELKYFRAENNLLTELDIRNSVNEEINEFVTTQNENLTCIYVDDSTAPYLAAWDIDPASGFVEDDIGCETLSVSEVNNFDFTLYPNPANNIVSINLISTNASLKLYSIKGQLLLERPLSQGVNAINISEFSSGLYVASIKSEGAITTKKLIIN